MSGAATRKLVVVGAFSVGKTSLVRRYIEDRFEADYRATLGVACFTKGVTLASGQELKQVIWDIEGGQSHTPIFKTYLRGAQAALLVADLTRSETLDELGDYFADVQSVCPGIAMGVALNKADLVNEAAIQVATNKVGERFGDLVCASSAATGQAVEQLFLSLGERAL